MRLYEAPVQLACYDNQLDAFIPELWAREGLEILRENMVAANLVCRDFENVIANYGDVVHTRRPSVFPVYRRTDSTTVKTQDAIATDVLVPLDQWFNETFCIRPGEMSKSFEDLTNIYLRPAMLSIARGIDRAILGFAAQAFLGDPLKRAGRLGKLDRTNVYDAVVEADRILNNNLAPQQDRHLLLSAAGKAVMLQCDKFVEAQKRGDGGTAMDTAQLGHVMNFDTYLAQNVGHVAAGGDTDASLVITNALGAGGSGAQACGGLAGAPTDGEYLVVGGNDQPTWIASHTADATSGACTGVTLNEANKYATAAGAGTVRYKACQAAQAYPAGWSEGIQVTGYTGAAAPQIGQLLAVGADPSTRQVYSVIESQVSGATCTVLLDRPLVGGLTAGQPMFPGPYGGFNVAWHRHGLALVTRPLAATHAIGIEFGVANDESGLGMRVSMQHKINEGLVVACDILSGVALLNVNLGVPLLS